MHQRRKMARTTQFMSDRISGPGPVSSACGGVNRNGDNRARPFYFYTDSCLTLTPISPQMDFIRNVAQRTPREQVQAQVQTLFPVESLELIARFLVGNVSIF